MSELDEGTIAVHSAMPETSRFETPFIITDKVLTETPPPHNYLLVNKDDARKGFLIRGTAGLLAARGGTGKTFSMLQLGIAVATGTEWLQWKAMKPGRALLLLAEETDAIVRERLFAAVRAQIALLGGGTTQIHALVKRNLEIHPLAGEGVALTGRLDENGDLPVTPHFRDLKERLINAAKAGNPFTLVVVDPLACFAGADVETDNTAGTRFVQAMEALAQPCCGEPLVIISHHFRKAGKEIRAGTKLDTDMLADMIRGSSGIVNKARFALALTQDPRRPDAPDLLSLHFPKMNNAPPQTALQLCRPVDWGGCLRLADASEVDAYAEQPAEVKADLEWDKVRKCLEAEPLTLGKLRELVGMDRNRLSRMLKSHEEIGEVGKTKGVHSPWTLLR